MMLDRFTQHTVDPLALMSNISHQQPYSQSSTTPPSIYVPPHLADNAYLDSGLSPMDHLIENLTNTLALLTQSYKTFLTQTNNQLKTSSNTRNQATVQDGRVVVQNVQGHLNRAQENGVAFDEEQLLSLAGGHDNVIDEDAPKTQTMFMANLSSADPVYDEASPSYDSNILSEVHDHDHYQDAVCEHQEEHEMHDNVQLNHVVDSHVDYTSDSNMISYDQYVKDNARGARVFNVATNPELNVARFTKMHVANTIVEARCLELEVELSNLHDKSYSDNHNELVNRFSNLEHYKGSYDSIKITHAKHIEQVTALTTKNVNLKAQILNKVYSISKDHVKPTVLAPGKYAIDVKPIPSSLRNNREAHLDYLRRLKESIETIREIVEEAKVVRSLDSLIVSACRYTKHSQELLEYAIGNCPNIRKHVAELNNQKTNVPVPPSTGVKHFTDASGSQRRSNTKKNRISPAKGRTYRPLVFGLMLFKTYDGGSLTAREFCEKVHRDSYGDCVIGDSVISRHFSPKDSSRTPQQNDIVKRRNRTLVEAARTMLIFSKALMFLVFGALCYPINNNDDLGKLQPKVDIGIFVGYAPSRKGLVPNPVPAAPYVPPIDKDLEILFQPMFDEYLEPPRVERPVSPAPAVQVSVNSAGTPSSTTID
nr:hypothetical protein [Tanacetum cinerariifolium]